MNLTIAQLAERLGADLVGNTEDVGKQISAVGTVDAACDSEITFVADDKHKAAASQSSAAAVIVSERIDGLDKPQLIVKNVNEALIETLRIFAPVLKTPSEGVDPTAKVAKNTKIAEGVSIGPCAVIDDGVEIGKNCIIGSGCKIGENSKLGNNCRLDSNVVIYHNCRLGNNIIIQANSSIGSTGFGYSFIDGEHKLIPHNGGVVIEDFVEIGANCCIDRAKFGNTIIGAGTKIDNLVQIAHNVIIGKCCLIAAFAGISGSCKLGDGVVLAGQVGLADNIEIGDGTMVPAGQKLAWTPAIERNKAVRIVSLLLRMPEFNKQLKELSNRIESLEAAEDDKK
jgi:UDP-3-O-[3-hydroxymyristoyl] glucosamine N-acyltransferase